MVLAIKQNEKENPHENVPYVYPPGSERVALVQRFAVL
jgi:hypothetical protein